MDSNHLTNDPEYHITLDYEFLDDTYSQWPCDIVQKNNTEEKTKRDIYSPEKIQIEMESKHAHTLSWMVFIYTVYSWIDYCLQNKFHFK